MDILIRLLVSSLAVFITAHLLPGIHLKNFFTAVLVAVVLGIVNAVIRPVLLILTLPINILTLGLFTFVVIGFLTLLVSAIVPGFDIDGFWWALAFAVVLSIINAFFGALAM